MIMQGSNFRRALALIIALCAVIIVTLGIVIWLATDPQHCSEVNGNSQPHLTTTTQPPIPILTSGVLSLDTESAQFDIDNGQITVQKGIMQSLLDRKGKLRMCSSGRHGEICLTDDAEYTLVINSSDATDEVKCVSVSHVSSIDTVLLDCFEYGDSHWYGAAEVFKQEWPIEKWEMTKQEYVTKDPYHPDRFGSVQERYWLSSAGIAIFVPFEIPLFVSMSASSKRMCFSSKLKESLYHPSPNQKLQLQYDVCTASTDFVELHKYMSSKYWRKPIDRPHLHTLVKPIWSTWAEYKTAINQTLLVEYANNILGNNLLISQLELDDDWTPHYGDWTFNTDKFPDANKTITELKARIPAVTVWVHPFINIDSEAFKTLADQTMLMSIIGTENTIPGLVKWWNPSYAGYLDFSNNKTKNWFLNKLNELKTNFNIDSFKFDAGEVEWMPKFTDLAQPYFHPSEYVKHYVAVALASDADVRRQEVRIGCGTQYAPILVRMLDRRSLWSVENGLGTLIPAALTFGIIGYPFVLPDMIGGNEYDGMRADAELFVRWLQVNSFLPGIQFSIPPWRFGDEVVNYTRQVLELRQSYTWLFDKVSNETVEYGWPMVRPLWWICPRDELCQTINDQYLLGNVLLVAPIVKQGATKRDIYIPPGTWKDGNNGSIIKGPKMIRDYLADLYMLPYFEKQLSGR